jgi:hypothetical protein
MKALLALAALVLSAACATVQRVPPPVEPVGRFEFTTLFQGQPLTGEIEVTGTPGAYRGRITTSLTPDLPVSAVAVEGREMIVSAETPQGPIRLRLVFVGDEFTGGWSLGGDTGELAGRRLP